MTCWNEHLKILLVIDIPCVYFIYSVAA